MPNEKLIETSDAVIKAYGEFTAPTEQGQQQLAKIKEHVKAWFDSPSLILTDPAAFSLDRLVDAELDHSTPGDQGLGGIRLGGLSYLPRLAARHRSAVARMDNN